MGIIRGGIRSDQGVSTGDSPTFAGLTLTGDLEIGSTNAFLYGDPTTDTTWRSIRDGTKLSFQRRENTAIATVASAPTAGGTGYSVDDVLTVSEGANGTVTVTAVSGGVVTAISLTTAGSGYTTGAGKATTGGNGTGCTIEILTVASVYVQKGYFDGSFHSDDVYVRNVHLEEEHGCLATHDFHAHGVPPMAGYFKFAQGTTPAAHKEAGHSILWIDGNEKLYVEKADGTDVEIGFAASAEYLQASKGADQINFSTGTNVIFDTVDISSGSSISLDTGTGKFTLAAGKTYRLTCGIRFEHTAAAKIGFAWYNITGSAAISALARLMNMKEAGDYSALPVTQTIITPSVETEVVVRCTWEGDGVEDVNAGYTWAIIEVIAGNALYSDIWELSGTNIYYNSGNVGVGTIPTTKFHVAHSGASPIISERTAAATSSVLRGLELYRKTSGTAAVGIGASMAFRIQDDGGNLETAGVISGLLTDPSAASEEGAMTFEVVSDSSLVAGMRIQGIPGGIVNVGIGLIPTVNMVGLSIEAGLLTLKETTSPTADTNYGKIYTKNDNKLYFQDGAGSEHEIAYVP